ncbi:MAG TPA: UDP-N-acetylmuramate dehydrogenase [bacterium]|nr:UDP-N-acetylmuramate dehydrogenase [Myxococcales bacterium]OQA60490.1 MAG: UDP-N-acetylenolpyruvoylglucosamine reductase [bacterium ADurb.Bin270]HPW45944.1 UDP-N-acetylmuramate dehydrogenase [bacterium]HQC50539.1 UDP-N-acetylmuramate dehydrogenase [bacterium]HQG13010.1 UDP-N-acetylmuramate dehydrogenase [bacterium]
MPLEVEWQISYKPRMVVNPFKERKPLSGFTTFRIGGPAPIAEVSSPEELLDAIGDANSRGLDWIVIGHGSNILAHDEGVDKGVIVFSDDSEPKLKDCIIEASAGIPLATLIDFSQLHSLSGLENLAGIPGSLGGAIAGNAGAYGSSISDCIYEIEIATRKGNPLRIPKEKLSFSYRNSAIKRERIPILRAILRLTVGERSEISERIAERIEDRKTKHPDYRVVPTAGSFFKNPLNSDGDRVAAGKLLDECGCRGMRIGKATTWHRHANIIVTDGKSSYAEVRALATMMAERVREKFGISLENEVLFLI